MDKLATWKILAISKKLKVRDCAQSHGASFKKKMVQLAMLVVFRSTQQNLSLCEEDFDNE